MESPNDYTQEQLDAVNRILQCTDYYEILGVPDNATTAEVTNAYRRLALEIHPDRNKCPGATQAFQAVGNAFSVLNDPERRARYDLLNRHQPPEDQQPDARNFRYRFYDEDGNFQDFEAAEDMFNFFFNHARGERNNARRGRRQRNNRRQRQRRRPMGNPWDNHAWEQNHAWENPAWEQNQRENPGESLWDRLCGMLWKILLMVQQMYQLTRELTLQLKSRLTEYLNTENNKQRLLRTGLLLLTLIPILTLVYFPVKNNFLVSDPIYSFQKSGKYLFEKQTATTLKVSFYVEKNFTKNYDGDLKILEANIEKEFDALVGHNCYESLSTIAVFPRDPTTTLSGYLSTSTVVMDPPKSEPGFNVFISTSSVIFPPKPTPRLLDINCYFTVPRLFY